MFDSPVLPLVALCAMVFGIVYINVTARHRQRMAMIAKGMDPGGLGPRRDQQMGLAFGLLMLGVGLGLFLGHLLAHVMPPAPNAYDPHPANPLPYFIMVLLCGGGALVAHHFIIRGGNKG